MPKHFGYPRYPLRSIWPRQGSGRQAPQSIPPLSRCSNRHTNKPPHQHTSSLHLAGVTRISRPGSRGRPKGLSTCMLHRQPCPGRCRPTPMPPPPPPSSAAPHLSSAVPCISSIPLTFSSFSAALYATASPCRPPLAPPPPPAHRNARRAAAGCGPSASLGEAAVDTQRLLAPAPTRNRGMRRPLARLRPTSAATAAPPPG